MIQLIFISNSGMFYLFKMAFYGHFQWRNYGENLQRHDKIFHADRAMGL